MAASKLQEKYLPVSDVRKVESVRIEAPPSIVYPLVEALDFRDAALTYWLFKLRGIPVPESMTLQGLTKMGFVFLEKIPGQEIILGLTGQFWTLSGKLQKVPPDTFRTFNDPAYAQATWSFQLTPLSKASSRLSTETRVFCTDEKAKRKFRLYWTLTQPFSSLTRREILQSVKKRAERGIPNGP